LESETRIWLNRLSRRELLKYGLIAGAGLAASDLIAACGGTTSGSTSTITMKLGSDSPLSAAHTLAMVTLKNQVESQTNGRIKCTIYPDGQLGANDVMLNSIKSGSLDATIVDMAVPSTAVPECGIFSMPFLFKDGQQALRAANGATGAVLKPKLEAAFACELLGWGTDGGRNMWNSKHPITTPADVKGLKMRTQQVQVQVDTYAAFGALPTPMAYTELYSALQTHVVDGGDNGPTDMVSGKLYEVTKYMTMTRHFNVIQMVVVSKKFMAKLTSSDQDVVRAAGKAGGEANATQTFKEEDADVAILKTKGIEVIEMSDPQAFVDIAKSVYAKNANTVGGAAFIAQAQQTT
jgi:TRAP-type transport system periplasmic protein